MKKVILSLLILNGMLILALVALLAIAEIYPFSPASPLYDLQLAAEQLRLKMTPGSESQALLAVRLADRRLADLALTQDHSQITQAVNIYTSSLQNAVSALKVLPAETQAAWWDRLNPHLTQAEIVARSLDEPYCDSILKTLEDQRKRQNAGRETASSNLDQASIIAAEPVPFLGLDVEHENFPLTGGHSNLDCAACHLEGVYADTPTTCGSCHQIETAASVYADLPASILLPDNINLANPYPDHFSPACENCHTINDWVPYQFDHAEVLECQSCHLDDLEVPQQPFRMVDYLAGYVTGYIYYQGNAASAGLAHYPGECMRCHTDTEDWQTISFNHSNILDCESCHLEAAPEAHYAGACMRCHTDVVDWNTYEFDHTGLTDCTSCHQAETPNKHYNGICSACHLVSAWEPAFFDHTGYTDCKACHQNSNHFSGQCSSCHNLDDWFEPFFNHNKFSNCAECHDAPGNHYPGQCSLCHNDRSWNRTSFSHAAFPDCQSCHNASTPSSHYTGTCANCHNTASWQQAIFSHIGLTDCAACHAAPDQHFPVACTACHNTLSWQTISFDHTRYTECLDCHSVPANHYPGLCLNCHNTTSWDQVRFAHSDTSTCTDCHVAPSGHWPGECASCHETTDWLDLHFDHTGYTNCKACHNRPTNHPRGQCSNCHTTESWIVVPTPTPTATPLPTTREREIRITNNPETDIPGVTYPVPPLPTPAPITP